jgi:hypothetical protein
VAKHDHDADVAFAVVALVSLSFTTTTLAWTCLPLQSLLKSSSIRENGRFLLAPFWRTYRTRLLLDKHSRASERPNLDDTKLDLTEGPPRAIIEIEEHLACKDEIQGELDDRGLLEES